MTDILLKQLADLTEETVVADDTYVYVFEPAAGTKDKKIKTQNLRAPSKVESLTNKTINSPATANPGYFSAVQIVNGKLTSVRFYQGFIAPGVLTAGSETVVTFAALGVAANDHIVINPTANLDAGIVLSYCWASAVDTVSVRVKNSGAASTAGTNIPIKLLALRCVAPDA